MFIASTKKEVTAYIKNGKMGIELKAKFIQK